MKNKFFWRKNDGNDIIFLKEKVKLLEDKIKELTENNRIMNGKIEKIKQILVCYLHAEGFNWKIEGDKDEWKTNQANC